MKNDLQAIATIFSLVNPGVCAMMFLAIEKGRDPRAQIIDATRAVLTITTILLVAAFLGAQILHIFGVSLDVFAVAGGIVLAWIGFSMLRGQGSASTPKAETASGTASAGPPLLAPLILFAASPV
jgi:small neutral amino acid transporter SnatA (MarC family)